MTTMTDLSEWDKDPRLFLFTSLTAGSSHIITATSRMETILKANRIPFQAIDTATDEKARKLWGRRAAGKKLPGLVKEGYVIADLEEVEEWNEFGELKENIGPVPDPTTAAAAQTHAVQTTLGSLRLHDAASQAAAGKPAPPVLNKGPTATAASSSLSSASKPPSASASALASDTASYSANERIATPLVEIAQAQAQAKAKKEADVKAASTAAAPAPAPATETPPTTLEATEQATKPETISSSVEDKKESIKAAEETEAETNEDEAKQEETEVETNEDEAKQEETKQEEAQDPAATTTAPLAAS